MSVEVEDKFLDDDQMERIHQKMKIRTKKPRIITESSEGLDDNHQKANQSNLFQNLEQNVLFASEVEEIASDS